MAIPEQLIFLQGLGSVLKILMGWGVNFFQVYGCHLINNAFEWGRGS